MVSRREWYNRANAEWPKAVPSLTADEAIRAARKLYYFVHGQAMPYPIKLTSGRRYTWTRNGVLHVNPERGWHSLVHLLSHLWHAGAHTKEHARFERRMIKVVVRRGWLDGKLKSAIQSYPSDPQVDVRAVRHARTAAAITRWETKERRAKNALKKLRRRLAYYDRVLALVPQSAQLAAVPDGDEHA